MPKSERLEGRKRRRGGYVAVGAAAFLLAFPLLFAFFTRHPQLYDNDAYYHLAVARAYWQEGLIEDLRWARFGAMGDGFGDKELLFHVLLAPLAGSMDPILGGQAALALLLAAIFASVSLLARPVLGWWALALPWWLAFSSTELAWRWVRLRPELLSLLLLLWALWALARGRYRILGLLGLLYALSYTAFHAFLGVCVLVVLFELWARRRFRPGALLYPTAGVALGLVAHPHFPDNLEIWVLQSVEFFRQRGALAVGTEIRPNTTDVTLMVNLAWFLGLAVLWLSAKPAPAHATEAPGSAPAARFADVFGVAAVAFSALYLLMSRFSLYAVPFVTLWALWEMARRGRIAGAWTRIPWSRRRAPLAVAAAVCLAVGAPEAARQWRNYGLRIHPGPDEAKVRDRAELAAALPSGARVAAPWQQTPIYMLWAPQALYLNVLDPVFLAAHDPWRHTIQERIFAGTDPDVPLSTVLGLDSRYLAFSPWAGLDLLVARLESDPRVVARHRGFNHLWEILPGANRPLLLDWHRVPEDVERAPGPETDISGWPLYPRLPAGAGGEVEGYVDTRRIDEGGGCISLVHRVAGGGERVQMELASWGPSSVWHDGELVARVLGQPHAMLGRGITFSLPSGDDGGLLTVLTCAPDDDPSGPRGFYLRRFQPL